MKSPYLKLRFMNRSSRGSGSRVCRNEPDLAWEKGQNSFDIHRVRYSQWGEDKDASEHLGRRAYGRIYD